MKLPAPLKSLWIPGYGLQLLLAVAATCALFFFNELGHRRSSVAARQASVELEKRGQINHLTRLMLNAETGQRGYLLTGQNRYLEPYTSSLGEIGVTMERLKALYASHPEGLSEYADLTQNVQRQLAEMALTINSYQENGGSDAWRLLLLSDAGLQGMNAFRSKSRELVERTSENIYEAQHAIEQSLDFSRMGISLVSLMGLIVFYLYLRQVERVRRQSLAARATLEQERGLLAAQVQERTAEIGELATYLQRVREQERGHLARELHDELGALLTAAKFDVARLKSKLGGSAPELSERLAHLTETLNSVIALKRRIVEDLRPSSLENLGLVPSLEILTREFSERAQIPVDATLEDLRLDSPEARLAVYRIVQESLTNAGKYARAARVRVRVAQHPAHAEVMIEDDGVGFDAGAQLPRATHGLQGMRHRVEAMGGRLAVESAPGAGTRVKATLPTAAATA